MTPSAVRCAGFVSGLLPAGLRRIRGARLCGAIALGALLLAAPARGAGLLAALLGAPPDSVAAGQETGPTVRPALLDALDRGFVTPEELILRRFGGDAGRTGADYPLRPVDLLGVGRGRTAWIVDGVPLNDGILHWDNPILIPLRGLRGLGEADALGDAWPGAASRPSASARADSSGRRDVAGDDLFVPPGAPGAMDARLARGPSRPISMVGLTGGDYGARLGSFNFRRRFGRVGVNADGASLRQEGWGDFGRNTRDAGTLRLDLPFARGELAVTLGTGNANIDFPSGGREELSESRFAFDYRRGIGRRTLRIGLERGSSGLDLTGSGSAGYSLTDNRVRLSAGIGPGTGGRGVSLVGSLTRESRRGLLPGTDHWIGGDGLLRWRGGPLSGWSPGAQLVVRQRALTGATLEPGVELERSVGGGMLRLSALQTTTLPGIVLNTGAARLDRFELETALNRLRSFDRPETHRLFTAALSGGGAFRWSLRGGATATSNYAGALIPPLALVSNSGFFPRDTEFVTPRADAAFLWRPRPDLELGAGGHFRGLDLERVPWESRLSGEGWVTLRRLYFPPDLNFGATLMGRLVGPRRSGYGDTYPTTLDGSLTLTATIRTLTLFWRIENMGSVAIESDLNDSSAIPILLPGLHNRIGATLHLLD